jgi:hypothetical protein
MSGHLSSSITWGPQISLRDMVSMSIACGSERAERGRMIVFAPGAQVVLHAVTDARIALLGGAPLDGERDIWWNFVLSSKDRIEQGQRRTGRKPASRKCPATRPNSSRSQSDPEPPDAATRALEQGQAHQPEAAVAASTFGRSAPDCRSTGGRVS